MVIRKYSIKYQYYYYINCRKLDRDDEHSILELNYNEVNEKIIKEKLSEIIRNEKEKEADGRYLVIKIKDIKPIASKKIEE